MAPSGRSSSIPGRCMPESRPSACSPSRCQAVSMLLRHGVRRGRADGTMMDAQTISVEGRSRLGPTGELIATVQRLSLARSVDEVQKIVRTAARELTGADGATFVLREGANCFY